MSGERSGRDELMHTDQNPPGPLWWWEVEESGMGSEAEPGKQGCREVLF